MKRIFAFTLITGRYLWGICLVCTMLSPCVDIYNLIISLYKCHNFMLRLSIHILEIITYYRQGKNMINISHSFFTLSVLITVLFVMISYCQAQLSSNLTKLDWVRPYFHFLQPPTTTHPPIQNSSEMPSYRKQNVLSLLQPV